MPEFEQYFLHLFAIIVYECITKDKVNLIPLWLHIIKSIKIIEEQPNSFAIWQIKLLSTQLSRSSFMNDESPLLSVESMLAIKQKTAIILDKWEHDMKSLFKEYLVNGMVQTDPISLAKMCAYFIFYDIPYPIDDKSISSLLTAPQCSNIPIVTLYKLRKILQTV